MGDINPMIEVDVGLEIYRDGGDGDNVSYVNDSASLSIGPAIFNEAHKGYFAPQVYVKSSIPYYHSLPFENSFTGDSPGSFHSATMGGKFTYGKFTGKNDRLLVPLSVHAGYRANYGGTNRDISNHGVFGIESACLFLDDFDNISWGPNLQILMGTDGSVSAYGLLTFMPKKFINQKQDG